MIQTKQFTLFRSSDPRPDITLSLFLTPHLEVYAACIFRHSILAYYLASILTSYLASFLASIRTFSLAFFPIFYLASMIYSDTLSGIYSGILSGIFIWHSILAFYLASILTFSLPWALWHSAVPTEIWSLRLRSASARWHLELAVEPTELLGLMVEVRLCPLRSGAGSSAAVPTEIWSSQFSGSAHWDLELEGRKAKQLW